MADGRPARAIRHVTSINDLSNGEIEAVFSLAKKYLVKAGDKARPWRIGSSVAVAHGKILACLFYEPSTRTRLSFESAMQRLGGSTISSADPSASSAAKGESLADTVRMVSAYADAIVIRHPRDGAAALAAEYADVPVINGGDGAHEHPTQTLTDLFTLSRECGKLKGLNVAIMGDLKSGRTVHSLVYALARFGANIVPMPAKGMELSSHVEQRLHDEFGWTPRAAKTIDALYITRFQKERWTEKTGEYGKVDARFMSDPRFAKAKILHPLPRVDELDPVLDHDPRAAYFRQAAYGVPVRMALLTLMLGLNKQVALAKRAKRSEVKDSHDRYCPNANCITVDAAERRFARAKFYALKSAPPRLRCFYCETDFD